MEISKSHLNDRIGQHCGVKMRTVTPSFCNMVNISLSCNNSIPSFIGNYGEFFDYGITLTRRNQYVKESNSNIPYSGEQITQDLLCVPSLMKCSSVSAELLQAEVSSQKITILRWLQNIKPSTRLIFNDTSKMREFRVKLQPPKRGRQKVFKGPAFWFYDVCFFDDISSSFSLFSFWETSLTKLLLSI